MIREGRYVMTVYNKNKVPHVIGFKHYKDAEKAMFQTDTRTVMIHEKINGHQLEIIKAPFVQFGKLHIDTVNSSTFLEYANRPQQPKIALVESLYANTQEHLLFDFIIISDEKQA
jgi:hypothetical protein